MKRKMRRRNWKHWTPETSRLAHKAKARKRMANPVEPEPRMARWNRFTITVTDRLTVETGTFELRSLRDVGRRLAVLLRYYR